MRVATTKSAVRFSFPLTHLHMYTSLPYFAFLPPFLSSLSPRKGGLVGVQAVGAHRTAWAYCLGVSPSTFSRANRLGGLAWA